MNFNIIANAEPLTQSLILKIQNLDNVIALDGVGEEFLKHKIIPDFVCGDFDSISSEGLKKLKAQGSKIYHMVDQNYSDLDKGIMLCDSMNASSIKIFNSLGGSRLDHTILNYRMLKRHHKNSREIVIYHKNHSVRYITNQKIAISGQVGASVSIMAYPKCIISSNGLLYDMLEDSLDFAYSESSSNSLAKPTCNIVVQGFALLITENSIIDFII